MDNETKAYLYDDLKTENELLANKLKRLTEENEELKKKLEITEHWGEYHAVEHKRIFEKMYGIKLPE